MLAAFAAFIIYSHTLHRPRLSSSFALWNGLGLSSVASPRKLYLAELMFECHNSLTPSYLTTLIQAPSHSYSTRKRHLINLPTVKSSHVWTALAQLPWCVPVVLPSILSLSIIYKLSISFYQCKLTACAWTHAWTINLYVTMITYPLLHLHYIDISLHGLYFIIFLFFSVYCTLFRVPTVVAIG